jgi:hypothetical protein
MPMDSVLFVMSDEMNISFGKFLPRYNYVEKKKKIAFGVVA